MASSAAGNSQLVWVDREGREIGNEGPVGAYGDLALSPDGGRLAYDINDGSQADIWIRDLRRGVAMRLTSDPKDDVWPVWSPDGTRIAFSSNRGGLYALMQKSSSGTGSDEPLYGEANANAGAEQWSPDGRFLAFDFFPTVRSPDIMLLTMQGAHQPVAYLKEEAGERSPCFSPDGRFIAYRSDETGRSEVYVQPYPATGAKWTISTQGGGSPQWRGDGKELFYQGPDDTFYAVPITLGPAFDAGAPKPLFKRRLEGSGIVRSRWVVTSDGKRFLLNAALAEKSENPFSVVVNWTQGLARE
jgi:Tol biopolymer transport system component